MFQNFFMRRLQYNQQARRFFMTIVALGFVIDGVYAVLLNLYLLRLGYDARYIGEVNSFGLLAFAVVSFPAGLMGARWTSGLMLRVGLGSVLCGTILLPLGEFVPIDWRGSWYIVTYALILTGFSLFFVNGAPFLMTVVSRDKQNSAFALQTALLSLAAFIGSLFGGLLPGIIASVYGLTLDDPTPYRYTLMLVGIVVFVAFLITLTIVEQSDGQRDAAQAQSEMTPPLSMRSVAVSALAVIGLMSLIRFLQVAGVATVSVYFNVYLDTVFKMPTSTIGTIASIGRLIAVPTVLLAPRLIRRTSTSSVAKWASLLTALLLLPVALAPTGWLAALGYIGVLAVTNLRFTAFIVYIMLLVPKRQQAIMAGAGETAAGFSFALMAWGGGYIVTFGSFRDLFLLGAFLSGLGTLIFWWQLARTNSRRLAQESHVARVDVGAPVP